MRKVFLAFALSLLFGCDGGQEGVSDSPMPKPVEFSVQTDDVTVNKLLPAIKNMLPGLNRYADQFQNTHVEQNYWLTIMFHIPENAKIPADYLSQGNNCFIEINKEGTAIKVPKRACKSVALDRVVQDLDSDYWFYLNSDNLTYTPYDFTKLNDKERVDIGVAYLKKVWDSMQMIKQKTDWQPDDFANYGRLFRQLEGEGNQFVTKDDMFPAYGSCRMVGANAQSWWSEQISSLKDLSSNDSQRIGSALKQIKRQYDSYHESAVSCAKEIRQAPPVEKKMEVLPPTSDNKPPRAGCLMIFTPDDKTSWSCPTN
ncbi:hypothetical protein QP556_11795 [Citrobacter freundii]|uniref:hypothetical protein n=1 Tax=Enterobacteriaceae TaxID=543 RepID=UPI0015FD06B3|nr:MULTISPECIES: hypothetical protein [Enterobacteriaceae]ELW9028218.1 hypothetical protein [Yersinia enterocolitica]MBA7988486.1 hypothetical protein [Enterobacter asburiae]MDK7601719.1 hypothetical protein [Citrobacter freundii]